MELTICRHPKKIATEGGNCNRLYYNNVFVGEISVVQILRVYIVYCAVCRVLHDGDLEGAFDTARHGGNSVPKTVL